MPPVQPRKPKKNLQAGVKHALDGMRVTKGQPAQTVSEAVQEHTREASDQAVANSIDFQSAALKVSDIPSRELAPSK